MKQKKRVCPFCSGASGSKISREHFWPDWAAEVLPKREKKMEYIFKGADQFRQITQIKKLYERQGSPSGITFLVPCDVCNNGWMSEIENEAKPIIQKLIYEKSEVITRIDAKKVTIWSFLKCAIMSYSTGDMPTISNKVLKEFVSIRKIPYGFRIWLFKHNSDYWRDASRWNSSRATDGRCLPDMSGPHNVSTLTIGFDKILLFKVFSWGVDFVPRFKPEYAMKIWPSNALSKFIIPTICLDEDGVNGIANFLPIEANDDFKLAAYEFPSEQ